ncbi:MAG TPA: hypothetical protein VN789_00950 [Casimicrobiaceae bacterium]|jgi:hypothetical protein|nr:hypothetical protein [Casimicrobiaceae bacterium]
MPSKEEAEAMADAILAAHRTKPGAGAPARAPGKGLLKYFLIAGFASGAIAAALPAHNFLIGGVVGLAIAGCVGAIVARRAD